MTLASGTEDEFWKVQEHMARSPRVSPASRR
jgi:hypothetical protein